MCKSSLKQVIYVIFGMYLFSIEHTGSALSSVGLYGKWNLYKQGFHTGIQTIQIKL